MTRWLVQAALWIHQNPGRTFGFGAAALVLSAAIGASQLNLSSDLVDLLPNNHPDVAKYKTAITEFNPLNRTFFALAGPSQDEMIARGDTFASALAESGLFSAVRYQWNADEILRSINVLTAHRAALFSESAQAKAEAALQAHQIKVTLANWKRNLMATPAPYLSQVFLNDPVGINTFLFDKLELLQSFGNALQTYRGRLFSADGTRLLIMAYPKSSPTEAKTTHAFTETVDRIVAQSATGPFKISWLGSHRFASWNERQMRSDVGWATTISLAGIVMLALLVFRRPLLPLIALTPVLCAALVSLSIVPWFFDPVSLVAIGVGSILFGLSIDYGLHVLYHLDGPTEIRASTIAQVLRQLTKPLSVSALTTIVAFACLLISDLPSYRQFGLIASVGMLAAWGFSLLFLPALAAVLPGRPRSRVFPIARLLRPFLSFSQRRFLLILLILAAVTAGAWPGVLRMEADGNVENLYLADQTLKEDMDVVNAAFGNAMKSVTMIAKGDNLHEALSSTQLLEDRLHGLKQQGLIDSYFTLAPFLPPRKTQTENISRWQAFWTEARLAELNSNLITYGKSLGMRAAAFAPFLAQIRAQNNAFVNVSDYQGTPLEDLFDSQLSQRAGAKVLANARLNPTDKSDLFAEQLAIDSELVDVINPQRFVRDMISLVFSELRLLAALAIVSVFTLLVLFQGFSKAIIMSLPLVVSLVWTFGAMGWLGLPINVMNCVIVLLIFGLVIDYSVFLTSAIVDREGDQVMIDRAMGAIFISALTTICAVGALATADHPALRAVGQTTLIGLSSGFIAVLVALPASLRGIERIGAYFKRPS